MLKNYSWRGNSVNKTHTFSSSPLSSPFSIASVASSTSNVLWRSCLSSRPDVYNLDFFDALSVPFVLRNSSSRWWVCWSYNFTHFFYKNNFIRKSRLKTPKIKNNELHHVFSVYQEHFKNKIKNIEVQIGEISRTPSLGWNLLVLKKEFTFH